MQSVLRKIRLNWVLPSQMKTVEIHIGALVGLLLAASALNAAETTAIYNGEYFYNFENAVFTPDGTRERWCIEGDMSRAERPDGWGTSYVVVQGTLGPEGSYGSLGTCKRVLKVKKLIKVSNMRGRN